jgi:uncharacterized protein YjbI with pentapeptide repeats
VTTKKFSVLNKSGKVLAQFDETDEITTIAEENFPDVDLSEKNIRGIHFQDTDFYNSTFRESVLQNVHFVDFRGTQADFSFAVFENVTMEKCYMYAAEFVFAQGDLVCRESELHSSDFSFSSFDSFSAEKSDLANSNFSGASIRNGNFEHANLSNTNFRRTIFDDKAKFFGANLIGAKMEGVRASAGCFAGAFVDSEFRKKYPHFYNVIDAESVVRTFLENLAEEFLNSEAAKNFFPQAEEFEQFQKHMLEFKANPGGWVDKFRPNRIINTEKRSLDYNFKKFAEEAEKSADLTKAMEILGNFSYLAEEVIVNSDRMKAVENNELGWKASSCY